MIEVLKQMVEALESANVDCSNFHHAKKDQNHHLGECPPVIRWHHAIQAGRQAIKELESQEPIANLEIVDLGDGNKHFDNHWLSDLYSLPCGDYLLYTHPPQRTEQNFCSRCGKRTPDLTTIHTCTPPQRKPLTDEIVGLLKEARKIIRASSSRNLVKDWDERTTKAIAAHGIKE